MTIKNASEREEFEAEWDQDVLAGHAEGTVTVEQCKEIAWDMWQAARAFKDQEREKLNKALDDLTHAHHRYALHPTARIEIEMQSAYDTVMQIWDARAQEDARDGARYRWLRNMGDEIIGGKHITIVVYQYLEGAEAPFQHYGLLYDAADAEIDAAMAEEASE